MVRLIAFALVVGLLPATTFAQTESTAPGKENSTDTEARKNFEAGQVAFAAGRYQSADENFRRAYELSGRPELQYNIALAADRMRKDDIALTYYEGFLRDVKTHDKRAEAEKRARALKLSLNALRESDADEVKKSKTGLWIGVIASVVAVAATITLVLLLTGDRLPPGNFGSAEGLLIPSIQRGAF